MINENRPGLVANPWGVIAPAAVIALLTIGVNTFTDVVSRVAMGVDRPPEEAMLVQDLAPGSAS
jgi:peptide/nickel transport system permease protein